VYLNVKHGWAGIANKLSAAESKMLASLGFTQTSLMLLSIASLAVAVLTVIPVTFFYGNVLNAVLILIIMALALKTGNIQTALMEIPFLAMPLVLIWLGHPLSK
jgi:hypothetical protein